MSHSEGSSDPPTTKQSADPPVASIGRVIEWHGRAQRTGKESASARANVARLKFAYMADRPIDAFKVLGNTLTMSEHEDLQIAIAGLCACYPDMHTNAPVSLGTACRRLRASLAVGAESLDLRMSTLLDASLSDALEMLNAILGQLDSKDKQLNFYDLYSDLRGWNSNHGYIQRRWAKDFWAGSDKTADSDTSPESGDIPTTES